MLYNPISLWSIKRAATWFKFRSEAICFSSLHKKARLKVKVETDTCVVLAWQHGRNLDGMFWDAERRLHSGAGTFFLNVAFKVLEQSPLPRHLQVPLF